MNQQQIIEFVLNDQRLCRSKNMQEFFKNKENQNEWHVIRFEGQLWFVSLGWRVGLRKDGTWDDNGFAGVRVREVACQGKKARSGYPSWQGNNKYVDVTEWFWHEYMEAGVVGFPDIWHIKMPPKLTSREAHCV
jgi:hypothetical protein